MHYLSLFMLLLANLLPLFGVLVYGWGIGAVIALYWVETILLGLLNILKIHKASGPVRVHSRIKLNGKSLSAYSKVYLVSFFMVHFGVFSVFHGFLVFTFFGIPHIELFPATLILLVLLLGHLVSIHQNFIGKEEYLKVDPHRQSFAIYTRTAVLQLLLLVVGLGLERYALMSNVVGISFAFVLLKTIGEYLAYVSERRVPVDVTD